MSCISFFSRQFTLWKFPGGLADLGENIGKLVEHLFAKCSHMTVWVYICHYAHELSIQWLLTLPKLGPQLTKGTLQHSAIN